MTLLLAAIKNGGIAAGFRQGRDMDGFPNSRLNEAKTPITRSIWLPGPHRLADRCTSGGGLCGDDALRTLVNQQEGKTRNKYLKIL